MIRKSAIEEVITEKDEARQAPKTAMQEVNEALKACGFGWFHARLLFTSLVGFVAGILVSNATPYILPIAECDLNMTLVQKGVLNAVPFIGMIISSVFAGFLTDTFGRKKFLLIGFGGIFTFMLISATSQTYEVLVTSKFFEGFLFAMSFNPVVTLTSEFCHSEVRDRVMMLQNTFAGMAQILIALMSWAFLTQDWNTTLFNGGLVLNTWNIYLLAMALWPLSAFSLYALLPESPKYCVTQKKYAEARQILIGIYKQNTGQPAETFPYVNIWKEKTVEADVDILEKKGVGITEKLSTGLQNIKPMFIKPLLGYLLLLSIINFLTMLLYNIIRLWFPQLSTIVEHYSEGSQDLCDMLDTYTRDLKIMHSINTTEAEVCVPVRSGFSTYLNSIIMGLINMIPIAVSGILISKMGKKNLFMIASLITVGVTLGLRWANSKTMMVSLFSIDGSVAKTMISLNQAVAVQLFPTTTRALAISMIMTSGRVGTLVGNVAFPILLSMGCVIPFYALTGVMICVSFMSLFIPVKKVEK